MKIKNFILSIFLLNSFVYAEDNQENKWGFDRFNYYFENDIYTQTDDGYSAGVRLSFLYFIENPNYPIYDFLFLDLDKTNSYFSFSLTNQIFTPTDTESKELQVDDRPYAGWTYMNFAIHKSSTKFLRTLSLKVGMIGPASGAEEIQNSVHRLVGSTEVKGWNNQLKNELGCNLKYLQKRILISNFEDTLEWSVIPFLSAELGNVAINASAGFNTRFGFNIQKDFGVSSIDIGGEPGIPIYGSHKDIRSHNWSFSLNLTASTSVVARDIFLDGNTFTQSHSVEKERFIYYGGFGFTLRYKSFLFDFLEVHNSKKFTKETHGHGVGTMVFSWLY